MTSGLTATVEHPIASLVSVLTDAVEHYAARPAWTLPASQIPELLADLVAAENALAAVRFRLLREADRNGVGEAAGHASTASWWAAHARLTRPAAHRELRLAAALDDGHDATATALSSGTVSLPQAAVILDAVDALPAEHVSPALRRDVETHLVALASEHDPKELRLLGRRVLDVLAPEVAEAHEADLLEREEQHAAATATFTMNPDGHGSMTGRFKIPVLAGEILHKHLAAIAAPRRHGGFDTVASATGSTNDRTRVSRPLRLGAAFVEYLETREATGTPKAGGLAATIAVTMTLENLLGSSNHPATLDTGATIPASQARRLACEAGIIPAVLGSRSQVLDLGRKTRFHTEPQRTALALRDRGCRAEHCDWPPAMCHAHHSTPWSRGGHTNIADGMLLCPRHHTLAHDARYSTTTTDHGKVRFTRRT